MNGTPKKAVSSDTLTIPLIDFSTFVSGSPQERLATAQAILSAFQTSGFIYISNHGINPQAIKSTFSLSAKFFARSQAEKESLGWQGPESNRGYSQPGREKTTDLTNASDIEAKRAEEGADLKESFEIGREGVEGWPNMWPTNSHPDDGEGREFREHMLTFHDECKGLYVQVMKSIAVGLGIEERWFDGYCDGGDNTLRLLHYPAVSSKVFKEKVGTVRAGAHTDYGSITLLFQDTAGGLQVLSSSNTYIDATPIPNTIVVNAADLLARWSNDTIKSTKHRVVQPPAAKGAEEVEVHPARYSVAYFCNPNFDAFIDAIPSTYNDARPKKYEGINSGEYLAQRLAATY
ncbi:hypothetical protein LTS14_000519 [Recurvomyces mirabilis]|nr:hypothetical protein LTS14_000519 [Recurvomyces mirabilis]